MFNRIKDFISGDSDKHKAGISIPVPKEDWDVLNRRLIENFKKIEGYFFQEVVPKIERNFKQFLNEGLASPKNCSKVLKAFYYHRVMTLSEDLKYIDSKYGEEFAEYFIKELYGSDDFVTCPYLRDFYNANDQVVLRENFGKDIANILSNDTSHIAMILRPFTIQAAIDLDFLCLAYTAKSFNDEVNEKAIFKQRDDFYKDLKRRS